MNKKLDTDQIEMIVQKLESGPRSFKASSILFYEGQVPYACYLLLKGEIILLKKNKKIAEVGPGHIVGHSDFQTSTPAVYTARIRAGSEVYIIDKSTFMEIKEGNEIAFNHLKAI